MSTFQVRLGRPIPSAPFGPFCYRHAADFSRWFVLVRFEPLELDEAECIACASPQRPLFGPPIGINGRPAAGELVEWADSPNGYFGAPY